MDCVSDMGDEAGGGVDVVVEGFPVEVDGFGARFPLIWRLPGLFLYWLISHASNRSQSSCETGFSSPGAFRFALRVVPSSRLLTSRR